jgi:hypothetical protein
MARNYFVIFRAARRWAGTGPYPTIESAAARLDGLGPEHGPRLIVQALSEQELAELRKAEAEKGKRA